MSGLGVSLGQLGPTWTQLGAKMEPKWLQLEPNLGQLGVKMAPTWAQLGYLFFPQGFCKKAWGKNAYMVFGPNLGPTWLQLGSNLGPTWAFSFFPLSFCNKAWGKNAHVHMGAAGCRRRRRRSGRAPRRSVFGPSPGWYRYILSIEYE